MKSLFLFKNLRIYSYQDTNIQIVLEKYFLGDDN
jgi:hypothetical protein